MMVYQRNPAFRKSANAAALAALGDAKGHRCETRGADVFDRYAGVMSLFHFLSMGVVAKAGGRGRKRLAKIEELHEDFHQFS